MLANLSFARFIAVAASRGEEKNRQAEILSPYGLAAQRLRGEGPISWRGNLSCRLGYLNYDFPSDWFTLVRLPRVGERKNGTDDRVNFTPIDQTARLGSRSPRPPRGCV